MLYPSFSTFVSVASTTEDRAAGVGDTRVVRMLWTESFLQVPSVVDF
jgi:hypothetical protein